MPVKDGQIFCSHEGVDEAVWECRLSGQSKITFEEAQKSEEKHRQILAVSNLVELKNQSLKCLNPNPRFKKMNLSPNPEISQFRFRSRS